MSAIPSDVRRFVSSSIPSVPFLEAMLLFYGSPQRVFTLPELAAALYLPLEKTKPLGEMLYSAGIIEPVPADSPAYRFAPRDEPLAHAIARLDEAYPKHLIEITHLVHDAHRNSAYRFADAFKLRKDS